MRTSFNLEQGCVSISITERRDKKAGARTKNVGFFNNNNKKKVLFTDGLCHVIWFSIGHCIKTKDYSTKNDKILNVTLSEHIEI